ncbi:MAG: hypothetical protein V4850_30595 [Myxococcota bacterium]
MPLDPASAFALKLMGSALAKTVLTSIGKALAEFQERKGERAVASLVAALGGLKGLPPDEAARELDELLTTSEPGVRDPHEALYETFRSFAFTRSEAAWPFIARMTAEYVERGCKVDSHFRRTAWLLERCDAEDVDLLVAALTECRGRIDEAPEGFHLLAAGDRLKVKPEHQRVTFDDGGMYLEAGHQRVATPSVARGLLVLLRDSRLALPGGHSDSCFLPPAEARRLIHLFILPV